MMARRISLVVALAWLFVGCGVTEEGPPQPTGQTPAPGSTVTPGPTNPGTPTSPTSPTDPTGSQPAPSTPGTPSNPTDPAAPAPSTPNPTPPGAATPGGSFAHIDPGCGDTGFQVNVGFQDTTCDTLWLVQDDVIQVTVGDAVGTVPPMAGRTYAIKTQAQVNIYPGDGEALAVLTGSNVQPGASGTFTIDPWTTGTSITGSYDIGFADGTHLKGTFRSDICPIEYGDCE